MKEERIKRLADCMAKIKEVQDCYIGAHTGWILLQVAHEHITSLHHLEAETKFDEEILGVKSDNSADQLKFLRNNPQTREEKLIMELIKDLDAVTAAFMKLNHTGNLTPEVFVILRDASIGYAGAMVRDLAKMLSTKEQQKLFLEEAKNIYLAYVEDVKEDLRCLSNEAVMSRSLR